jgi:hypothetical protein
MTTKKITHVPVENIEPKAEYDKFFKLIIVSCDPKIPKFRFSSGDCGNSVSLGTRQDEFEI